MKANMLIPALLSLFLFSCVKTDRFENYFCELSFGEAVSGQVIIVEHELTLSGSECTLAINGFQVSEVIVCSPKQENGGVNINFVSYSTGSIKNQYDVQLYKPGETLFQLKGDPKTPKTIWKSLYAGELKFDSSACFVLK